MRPVPNVAVNILRETPPFRNVSLRLLRDLVALGTPQDCPKDHPEQDIPVKAAMLIVCRGSVQVRVTDPDGTTHQRVLKKGSLHWPGLQRGVVPDLAVEIPTDREIVAKSTSEGTQFISFDEDLLLHVLDDAPVLAATLDPMTASPEVRKAMLAGLRKNRDGGNHAILLAQDEASRKGSDAREPLAHLLAESLARQFNEPAAVVTFGHGGNTVVGYKAGGEPLAPITEDSNNPFAVFEFMPNARAPLRHVIYVEPTGPAHAEATPRRYHRVLYLTHRLPRSVPGRLLDRLHSDLVRGDTAYFSAFVPSILLPDANPKPNGGFGGFVWNSLFENESDFETTRYDLDGEVPRHHRGALAQRIDRDSCRLRFDPALLAERWQSWRRDAVDDGTSFAQHVGKSCPTYRATADRWARAVTNRRVGIAMSGGGAASYRLIPVLRKLEDNEVPIDVIGGVSGGALLAAYYCSEGAAGFDRAVASAPNMWPLLLAASMRSKFIEDFINMDLGHRVLDDLEVRYVAITATTDDHGRPEAHAITRGTVGEVVRVSGAAPALFSPTEKNGHRYADGTCALAIPARVLKDYGADIVFACNSIPGPMLAKDIQNGSWTLRGFFYRETWYGRAVDATLAIAFLIERLSAEMADDAHGYICSPASENALETTTAYHRAAELADPQNMSAEIERQTAGCIRRWREFLRGGRP